MRACVRVGMCVHMCMCVFLCQSEREMGKEVLNNPSIHVHTIISCMPFQFVSSLTFSTYTKLFYLSRGYGETHMPYTSWTITTGSLQMCMFSRSYIWQLWWQNIHAHILKLNWDFIAMSTCIPSLASYPRPSHASLDRKWDFLHTCFAFQNSVTYPDISYTFLVG